MQSDRDHFICIHCNRLVERATYAQHHCPMLDRLRAWIKTLSPQKGT
jgi:hypothetical protein